jgi:hypothetical protein
MRQFAVGMLNLYWRIDDKSSQLLLGVGIGAILYTALSLLNLYRRCCHRRFECIGADLDAGLDQRLVVSTPSTEMTML